MQVFGIVCCHLPDADAKLHGATRYTQVPNPLPARGRCGLNVKMNLPCTGIQLAKLQKRPPSSRVCKLVLDVQIVINVLQQGPTRFGMPWKPSRKASSSVAIDVGACCNYAGLRQTFNILVTFQQRSSNCLDVQMIFEALPEGTVEFGHAFTDYQEDENGVSIGFKDKAAVRARYLVGADGYFSPVREALLHDGPPEFTVSSYSHQLPHSCSLCSQSLCGGHLEGPWMHYVSGGGPMSVT